MKNLFYSGLTVLMVLFALVGLSQAENTHTFTFNPPSGSTVAAGGDIQVTVSPAEDEISFEMFATMEEAQAATPSITWGLYGVDGIPTVTTGKTVLKVAVNVGSFTSPEWEVAYAEYTVSGRTSAKPKLTFSDIYEGNKYGRYVPFHAALMYEGEDQPQFEVYYALAGATPSKAAYNPDDDEIRLAVATDRYAEIMLSEVMAPNFKAVAYLTVDGETIVSDMVELNLTAVDVPKPEFDTAARVLEKNTVLKIKDNAGGSTILYSKDGKTLPLDKAYFEDDNPNVFRYKDEDGIVISEDMTIWAIAYKNMSSGDGDDESFGVGGNVLYGGSEILRGRFTLARPAVRVALSTEEWTIGEDAPTITVTVPADMTLGTQAGNVAVKLYIYNDNPEAGWEQIVTESGAALDMSKATEAGHEDFWTIKYSLVKGDNTSEAFEGDMTVEPEMAWLTIAVAGEKPAAPVFSVPSGEVEKGTKVALTCPTEGATIYYTYGDELVNIPYTTEFTINSDISIRAMAEKDGKQSDIVRATYTVKAEPLPTVTVTMTPAPGEIEAGTELEIAVSEEIGNLDIVCFKLYPTLDSAKNDITFNNTYEAYPGEGKPVPTVENPVVRVGFYRESNRQWDYSYFTYYIMKDIPMPIITPEGGEVEEGTEVEIKLAEGVAEGVKILYTVNDSLPVAGKDYTLEYTQKIVVNESMTLKAMAFKAKTGAEGRDLVSNVAEASFTVVEEPGEIDTIIFTFKPAPGEVADNTKVTIEFSRELGEDEYVFFRLFADRTAADTCADDIILTEGNVYGEPNEDIENMGYPVITKAAPVLKVGYITGENEEGEFMFSWIIAEYTVKADSTSNETKELAGVSIYPNPSDGAFKVEVPVAAEVEIINTSGVVVKHATVAAGVTALRLENSGLYFVRFTANGQVDIKKLVVR